MCTVSKPVITNVKNSLGSYIKGNGKGRDIVVATPRALTAKQRNNLENAIDEKGFRLIQIHGRDALANLLYSDSRWCKELLGLTGTPQALTILPKTTRPFLDIPLIGRDDDIKLVENFTGDSILVGQPGSGKTTILYQLVKNNDALFLAGKDETVIANEIRDKKPEIIIVDDAHLYTDLLKSLLHLRKEINADFKIIASCWPSYKSELQDILQLPDTQTNELPLLTRDEIVKVINAAGIYGPNDLIREINHQSRGKPGLAVILSHLIKAGGINEVGLGDALARNIKHSFEPLVGKTTTQIIAAFSLGGDAGFSIEDIAGELGLSVAEVQHAVIHLATGGVLEETRYKRLAVYPERLRHALIRDLYFSGAISLSPVSLINKTQDQEGSAISIICAKALGGKIESEFLENLINRAPTEKVCEVYCSLGPHETAWIIEKYSHHLNKIARLGLIFAPDIVIPKLLDQAPAKIDNLHSNPSAELRKLQDWCLSGYPGRDAVSRRKSLLDATLAWYNDSKEKIVAVKALQICMHPGYENTESDPGLGMTLTISRGHVLPDELRVLSNWWDTIFGIVKEISPSYWGPLWELIDDWAYPGRHTMGNPADPEFISFSKIAATQMLKDICSLYPAHNGIKRKTQSLAKHAKLNISIQVNEEFDALYPLEDLENYEGSAKTQKNNADDVVCRWINDDPDYVARKISTIEKEAAETDITYPCWTQYVCRELANKTNAPMDWLHAFSTVGLEPRLLHPFLDAADIVNNDAAHQIFRAWLENQYAKTWALQILLDHPDVPDELLSKGISNLEKLHSQMIAFHKTLLPESFVIRLLEHNLPEIRSAAVIHEWNATKRNPRMSLINQWESVVTDTEGKDYHFKGIFKHKTDLGCVWLQNKIKSGEYIYETDNLVKEVLGLINDVHRKTIISTLDETSDLNEEFIQSIINKDLQLYKLLLDRKLDKDQHLSPLKGYPSVRPEWIGMVKLALSKGYTHQDIVFATYGRSQFWHGPDSEYHAGWENSFAKLIENDDEDIRKIGELGKKMAGESRARALEKEKKQAIYGFH